MKLKRNIRTGKFGKEIYISDTEQGGYTAFFADFPNIVVEGDTIKEAQSQLWKATYAILKSLTQNLKK